MYVLIMINKKEPNDTNIVGCSTNERRNGLIYCLPSKMRQMVREVPAINKSAKLCEDENHIWRIQVLYKAE